VRAKGCASKFQSLNYIAKNIHKNVFKAHSYIYNKAKANVSIVINEMKTTKYVVPAVIYGQRAVWKATIHCTEAAFKVCSNLPQ
jgi:phenylpyruvate tautomerase PptA (4-oxalocrotonate tautomerase family)